MVTHHLAAASAMSGGGFRVADSDHNCISYFLNLVRTERVTDYCSELIMNLLTSEPLASKRALRVGNEHWKASCIICRDCSIIMATL